KSLLGYCVRDSSKLRVMSAQDNDTFVQRILQCPLQKYRVSLASFDWNYFDEHRLALYGSNREYYDYNIPPKSIIAYSAKDGLLWCDGKQTNSFFKKENIEMVESKVVKFLLSPQSDGSNTKRMSESIQIDYKSVHKDCQTTVEKIQQSLRRTGRDLFPYSGILDILKGN
ncbi:unnamed protein product, partial [Didymodactylos carnosus]